MGTLFSLSCKKATELIEKKQVAGLSIWENMRLKYHTRMCDMCSTYEQQSQEMEKAIRKAITEAQKKEEHLTEEQKQEIISKLK